MSQRSKSAATYLYEYDRTHETSFEAYAANVSTLFVLFGAEGKDVHEKTIDLEIETKLGFVTTDHMIRLTFEATSLLHRIVPRSRYALRMSWEERRAYVIWTGRSRPGVRSEELDMLSTDQRVNSVIKIPALDPYNKLQNCRWSKG